MISSGEVNYAWRPNIPARLEPGVRQLSLSKDRCEKADCERLHRFSSRQDAAATRGVVESRNSTPSIELLRGQRAEFSSLPK
ncbi:MAG TPA: hypothetical protein VMU22_00250 [Rhizomicrobium sp.]|nr:hypothetical protein [Rhizomicrobium sp.]